jgi:hypothetical protein
MEPLPGEVGSPTDYTFEETALQGGFFFSGCQNKRRIEISARARS